MGDWEKGSSRNHTPQQQGMGFHHHGHGGRDGGGRGSRASSKHGKPPASGSWQATVPMWERQFCYHVGSISWRKLCESKTFMNYHKNIVNWDDSAGEEAFHNAKARYWAQINDLPCDIPLPDRDMYIDDIDWEAEVDHELYLDLDKDDSSAVPSDSVEIEKNASYLTSGWDSFPLTNEEIQPTGWVINNEYPVVPTDWRDLDTKENNSSDQQRLGTNCWGQNNGWVTSNEAAPLATSGWEDVKKNSGNNYWNLDGGWGDDKVIEENSWEQWDNSWQNNDRPREQWETSQLKSGTDYDHSDHRTYYEKMENDWNNYHFHDNNSRYCRGRRTKHTNGRAFGHSKWNRAPQNWNSLHTCGPTK